VGRNVLENIGKRSFKFPHSQTHVWVKSVTGQIIETMDVKMKTSIVKVIMCVCVLLLAACGSTGDSSEILPTLMPEMSGDAPAPSYLVINGHMQTAKVGSYCWDYIDANNEPVGACSDSIGISTPIEPLSAERTISAQFFLPYATAPNILSLGIFTASNENEIPLEVGADLRLWSYLEGINRELALQPRQEVKLELEPGLYVFNIWAVWHDKGEVTYGFLVEVN